MMSSRTAPSWKMGLMQTSSSSFSPPSGARKLSISANLGLCVGGGHWTHMWLNSGNYMGVQLCKMTLYLCISSCKASPPNGCARHVSHMVPQHCKRPSKLPHGWSQCLEATPAVVDQIDLIVNNGCAAMHAARGRMSTAGAPTHHAPLTKVATTAIIATIAIITTNVIVTRVTATRRGKTSPATSHVASAISHVSILVNWTICQKKTKVSWKLRSLLRWWKKNAKQGIFDGG